MNVDKRKKELAIDLADLDKARKHYRIQSEWFRLMYAMQLEYEVLEKIS